MSTNDVPGANAGNADVLRAGCWAEHEDGSLIYVKGTEQDRVVYDIFDMSMDPPVAYADAMPETAFKKQFSYPPTGTSRERFTWHDKSPFPWDRVMRRVERPRPGYASAADQLSAAQRIATSLGLRGGRVREEHRGHSTTWGPSMRTSNSAMNVLPQEWQSRSVRMTPGSSITAGAPPRRPGCGP